MAFAAASAPPSSPTARSSSPRGRDRKPNPAPAGMRAHAAQIDLDVERTFPNHPEFRAPDKGAPGGTGAKLEPLRRVLMALAHSRPDVGYTQGLNFVAGWCMLVLDRDATDHAAPGAETETTARGSDPNADDARTSSEERAYWLCASLLEDALAGYFSPGLASLRDDLDALDADFRAVAPAAHRALDDMGCAVKFFCPRWLLCVMVGTAPTAVTLRVWDAVLVDSDRRPRDVLRRCALAALEARAGAMAAAPGMGEAVDAIRTAGAAVEDVQAFLRRVRDAPKRDAARARRAAEAARAADAACTPARDPRPTPALRPALTPFGNLLSVFQPTPRKRDAATGTAATGTAAAPRRLLWGGARPVAVVDENAFAVDRDVEHRDASASGPSLARHASVASGEFISAAKAKLAETMENALSPGFRRVGSRGRDAAAEDVDVVGANLAAAAEAIGVTLVGHSVSFDKVGKRTAYGRADARASERASERASGRREARDDDDESRERGKNKRARRAPGEEGSEIGIEMRDLGTKGGAAPRSPLGPIGRARGVDALARARGTTSPSSSKGGGRGVRAVVRTGPMATWASPERSAAGGGYAYDSPVRGGGFGSPLATRSPLARMR